VPNKTNILVVEDDPKIAATLREGLEEESYQVKVATTGEDAFFLISSEPFSLVCLDIMLPGRSGIEVLRAVRKLGLGTPVLLLTAKDAVESRVEGLDAGADDYLVKPFAFPELLARMRSLLRRTSQSDLTRFQIADLEFNARTRHVTRSGKSIDLTLKEFDLLDYLLRNKGNIVSREMLAKDVWKEARATPLDNVIDVHMARLRRKIDSSHAQRLIHTVRGVGFMLKEEGA
jgi:two-component system, OmpR family, copper resistance phosphate regulon response regulator CusR